MAGHHGQREGSNLWLSLSQSFYDYIDQDGFLTKYEGVSVVCRKLNAVCLTANICKHLLCVLLESVRKTALPPFTVGVFLPFKGKIR